MHDVYEDIRQIRGDLTSLVSSTSANTTTLDSHTETLRELKDQMKTALMPILFAKWTLAVLTGLATISGIVWGVIKGVVYAVTVVRPNHS